MKDHNIFNRMILLLFVLLTAATACDSEEVHNSENVSADSSELNANTLQEGPTNPEGGAIPGKVIPVSNTENDSRIEKNKTAPIEFGQSVAHITLDTSYYDAGSILSAGQQGGNGFVTYEEGISVRWGQDGERHPEIILINSGYLGTLTLADLYGEIRVGDSFANTLARNTNAPDEESFILHQARHFDGKEPDYSCLQLNSCSIQVSLDFTQYLFRSGGIIVKNNPQKTVESIFIRKALPEPTPPMNSPVIFGQSVAGITMETPLSDSEAHLGKSVGSSSTGGFLYDNGNIEVVWNFTAPHHPLSVIVGSRYAGEITIPHVGATRMGSSFASSFSGDNGKTLMKEIGRALEEKDSSWDCERVRYCQLRSNPSTISFAYDKGVLVFANNAAKTLLAISLLKPDGIRSDPRNDAVTFPTSVGSVTLSTTQEEAKTILGDPSFSTEVQHFYDNDNLVLLWGTSEPKTLEIIQLNFGYNGIISFPDGFTDIRMGHSFADSFPASDPNGAALIRKLGIHFSSEVRESTYNCLIEKTCAIVEDHSAYLIFQFENGNLYFSKDATKELRILDIRQDNLFKPVR